MIAQVVIVRRPYSMFFVRAVIFHKAHLMNANCDLPITRLHSTTRPRSIIKCVLIRSLITIIKLAEIIYPSIDRSLACYE